MERLNFCLPFIRKDGFFYDMYSYEHIGKKWFYITRINQKCYLLPDKEPPERFYKSKRFITKVMFMAAVARPRYGYNKKALFDGKIGIWPFVCKGPAKGNDSKNRAKGTIVTKNIQSINKEETRKMIMDKVIPVMEEKWPADLRKRIIIIQRDNAKPHCSINDELIVLECRKDG